MTVEDSLAASLQSGKDAQAHREASRNRDNQSQRGGRSGSGSGRSGRQGQQQQRRPERQSDKGVMKAPSSTNVLKSVVKPTGQKHDEPRPEESDPKLRLKTFVPVNIPPMKVVPKTKAVEMPAQASDNLANADLVAKILAEVTPFQFMQSDELTKKDKVMRSPNRPSSDFVQTPSAVPRLKATVTTASASQARAPADESMQVEDAPHITLRPVKELQHMVH
jgi:hypothetical protein